MAKTKVTRENWVETGLIFFSNHGESGINVEGIAKSLDCSKGSFYYYFKNRENYVKEIINLWIENNTLFPKNIETESLAWTYLFEMFILKPKDDFLFHLRHYAHDYPIYQNMLNVIEKKLALKIKRIISVIANETIATEKSNLLYTFYIGWLERYKKPLISNEELESELVSEINKIV